jgi:ubiquinone/menaquinone biosynthesis C-methylase UbiE
MPIDQEVRRLVDVYAGYEQDEMVQSRWSDTNPGNQAILRERGRLVRSLLHKHGFLPLMRRQVLDVGCGSGDVLASFKNMGAQPENLFGVDLLSGRIEEARRRHSDLHLRCSNAERLEFSDTSFDLVLLFTVISSILDEEMAHNIAAEIQRVLKPGGAVLWYDFRYDNPRNPHTRAMTREHIRQLFSGFEVDLQTVTLLPPLARRLGRAASILYPVLTAFPPLRTHLLGLMTKPKERVYA